MLNIKKILKENIVEFNKNQLNCIKKLKNSYPEGIEYRVKNELDKNIRKLSSSKSKIRKALKEFQRNKYQKNKVYLIANDFLVRKSDMEKLLTRQVFKQFENLINQEDLKDFLISYFEQNSFDNRKLFNFIKNNLKKDTEQFLPYILRDGYDQDYAGLEIGTNASNEGDGAEHLFVAKAMIAGFNCSVVDIGSSKYDAVIEDQNGDLLKVQIKSFGKQGVFARQGRDRGGEGQDSSNPANKGVLATSKNCDIFAAVNKSSGEIFIFSKNEIDNLPEKGIKRSDYMNNWENWSKINECVD